MCICSLFDQKSSVLGEKEERARDRNTKNVYIYARIARTQGAGTCDRAVHGDKILYILRPSPWKKQRQGRSIASKFHILFSWLFCVILFAQEHASSSSSEKLMLVNK